MRFTLYLVLLALAVVCRDATCVGSPPDSKKMEVKKALTRLRRIHRTDTENRMIIPPYAAFSNLLHSTSTTSAQSSQILHAVQDNTPLPKAAKAFIAVLSVGIITGAVIGSVMLTKMLNKAISPTDSDAA
ncbi:hypothetical protein DVH05_015521 [Phytophthora capsici]|nr:hypothetical protein DVH05_018457 [Phytophthora capsici]KAG1698038.1 hypothetical protein DVH05_015521 [Phytophthora capsici]|eukprot:jgi/Phyca11/509490/fgenesh2_kg.PHYCAscaffold_46_\